MPSQHRQRAPLRAWRDHLLCCEGHAPLPPEVVEASSAGFEESAPALARFSVGAGRNLRAPPRAGPGQAANERTWPGPSPPQSEIWPAELTVCVFPRPAPVPCPCPLSPSPVPVSFPPRQGLDRLLPSKPWKWHESASPTADVRPDAAHAHPRACTRTHTCTCACTCTRTHTTWTHARTCTCACT